jgi:7-cyano-7-deazaguanine synthase
LNTEKPAVVLLSGGLDSATVLAMAQKEGFSCYALTVDYGQHHRIELDSARAVAIAFGVREHLILKVDLHCFGGSALTTNISIPIGRDPSTATEIPPTYVPARNTVLLSLALAWAEALGADDIFIGVNAIDFSGYPDCRPKYIALFQELANIGTKAGVEGTSRFQIHAPLMELDKAAIVRLGADLLVDFGLTWSCYNPQADNLPCGSCDACMLRTKGFTEAGIRDPLVHGLAPGRLSPTTIPRV